MWKKCEVKVLASNVIEIKYTEIFVVQVYSPELTYERSRENDPFKKMASRKEQVRYCEKYLHRY